MARKRDEDRRQQVFTVVVAIAKAITAAATLLIMLTHGS